MARTREETTALWCTVAWLAVRVRPADAEDSCLSIVVRMLAVAALIVCGTGLQSPATDVTASCCTVQKMTPPVLCHVQCITGARRDEAFGST